MKIEAWELFVTFGIGLIVGLLLGSKLPFTTSYGAVVLIVFVLWIVIWVARSPRPTSRRRSSP